MQSIFTYWIWNAVISRCYSLVVFNDTNVINAKENVGEEAKALKGAKTTT